MWNKKTLDLFYSLYPEINESPNLCILGEAFRHWSVDFDEGQYIFVVG